MNRVILIDTETTGILPSDSRCIEVAVTLYDVQRASPISSYSSLIGSTDTNPVEHINGISSVLLKDAPVPDDVWDTVQFFVDQADAILAHNATFDFGFVPESIQDAAPWICTMNDIDWPKGKKGSNLTSLLLAHGLGVVHAHRAASDVDMLSRLLTRTAEMSTIGLDVLLKKAQRPKKKFMAMVSYDDRGKAKDNGFAWEASRKLWWRAMPEDDISTLPFKVKEIDA